MQWTEVAPSLQDSAKKLEFKINSWRNNPIRGRLHLESMALEIVKYFWDDIFSYVYIAVVTLLETVRCELRR